MRWHETKTLSRIGRSHSLFNPVLRLSTCPLVVNFICHLLTNGCQFEKLLLSDGVFRDFGKLPICRRLLPEIV